MKKKKRKITAVGWVFLVLRALVIFALVRNIFMKNYEYVFTCILTLILFILPFALERRFKVKIPDFLEIVILLFIFSAEILGEINSFYTRFPLWDDMLHTINGFIMAAIGLSMIELLNESKDIRFKLSPLFVAVVSFCFSMMIGVIWEFFEYKMDVYFDMDMQKDTVVNKINSVNFDPDGLNNVHHIEIESVVINGEDWQEEYGGYLDIGLHDTMSDLLVNFYGAFTFSVIGYFYSKQKDDGKLKRLLIRHADR